MITRIIERWTGFCLRFRKTVLALLAIITAVTASTLPDARFDNALEFWFLDDDPAIVAHRRLLDAFASDELIVIGLEAPDVFAPDVLELIERLTGELEKAPHVEKVFSLTSIESITGEDDMLEVGELIAFPLDPQTLPAVRERALAHELYVGNVVSASGDFACLIARLPHRADDFDYKLEAVTAIRAIVESAQDEDVPMYLSGGPVFDERFYALSEQDSWLTMALMFTFLIVALGLLLRSISGILLPMATVVIAIVWTVGAMVLFDVPMTVITTMLPPLLLAVGVADSMHVLVDYRNRCSAGQEKLEALEAVYRELMVPLFLTSLTTSIGMLSLRISRVQGIRDFGLFAAFGVGAAFLLSISLIPIAVSYLPRPRVARTTRRGLSAATLTVLHTLTMRYGRAIVLVAVALLALGVAGGTRVRAESAFLEYFKEQQQVRVDTRRIEDALAGTITIEIMIDTGREDGIKDPRVLTAIAGLQDFLESEDDVSSSQSVTDFFKDLRRAFFDNDQREYRLPETTEEAAQYLLLYEMDAPDGDIREYVTFDYSQARVSARIDMSTSNAASALVDSTREYIARNFPRDVSATVAGVALLYTNMEEYIRQSLIRGFTLALAAIFVVMCIQLRSIVLGAIAMIPNVVPIVICLGIMGLAGIRLDTMTSMVASISIGLAVDDSIHFMTRVRQHLAWGARMGSSLLAATVEVGRALVYTSLTLVAGFAVMLTSSFVGTIYFGLLCMLTIVFALLADLLLLPVVLRWYSKRRRGAPVFAPTRTAAGRIVLD